MSQFRIFQPAGLCACGTEGSQQCLRDARFKPSIVFFKCTKSAMVTEIFRASESLMCGVVYFVFVLFFFLQTVLLSGGRWPGLTRGDSTAHCHRKNK